MPADTILHLRDLAFVNEGIQRCFVWENGTLICQRVVFKASEAPHISGSTSYKVALLVGCTFEPGSSISLGDDSCELYTEDCIVTANLTVNGSPTRTGQVYESVGSVSQSLCEEHQLPGAHVSARSWSMVY